MDRRMLAQVSLDSTDYEIDAISNYDYRFEAGKKDALFLHLLGIGACLVATAWMYVFGSGDPSGMSYFLGFPVWISGTVLIYLAMFVVGIVYISKWKIFPFTARDEKKGGNDL